MNTNDKIDKLHTDLVNAHANSLRDLQTNLSYYDSEPRNEAMGLATPREMRKLITHVGYSRLYVNAVAERLVLEGFRLPGESEADKQMARWWNHNQLDFESILGHTEALIHGRSYITISKPNPLVDIGWPADIPIIRVESAMNLYAEIDPRTRQVMHAVRVVPNLEGSDLEYSTLYTRDQIIFYRKVKGEWVVQGEPVTHELGIVPVVPLTNRAKVSDLYGTSEITPEIRTSSDTASALMMNMRTASELLAVPQRLIFGATKEDFAQNGMTGATFDAYMARILAFEDPATNAMQFAAAELRNFKDGIEVIDAKVASYTGLPPQYLSQTSDNPASAEAIQAAESRLVKLAERKNQMFGAAWEVAMIVAHKVMANSATVDEKYTQMTTIWRNPATPTYQSMADGVTKLYNSGNGVIPLKRARKDMGYTDGELKEMDEWDKEAPAKALVDMYQPRPNPTPSPSTPVAR